MKGSGGNTSASKAGSSSSNPAAGGGRVGTDSSHGAPAEYADEGECGDLEECQHCNRRMRCVERQDPDMCVFKYVCVRLCVCVYVTVRTGASAVGCLTCVLEDV
jgi:hypothetical protein